MKIRLSNKALVIVDALVATGLYGSDREACVERLFYERLLMLARWRQSATGPELYVPGMFDPAAERRTQEAALIAPPPELPKGFERALSGEVAQKGWVWWYHASGRTTLAQPGVRDRGIRTGAVLLKPTRRGRKQERHHGRTALERGVNVKPIHTMAKVRPGLYNYRGYAIEQRAGEWVVLAEDGESVFLVATKLQSMRRKIDAAERASATKAHGNE